MTGKRKVKKKSVWPCKLEVHITQDVKDNLEIYAKACGDTISNVTRVFLAEGLQKRGYLAFQGGEVKT